MTNRAVLTELLQSKRTFGSTMLGILTQFFGEEPLGTDQNEAWDPETILMSLQEVAGIPISGDAFNRLMGAVWCVQSDAFYKDLPAFIAIVNALSGGTPPHVAALPDAMDLAWGMTEGLLLWPPDRNDREPFCDEILAYTTKALEREGILNPPDILRLGFNRAAVEAMASIHATYSDDPNMYQAIQQMELSKTTEINDDVRENLTELMRQLGQIGEQDTAATVKQMLGQLEQVDATSGELVPYEPKQQL